MCGCDTRGSGYPEGRVERKVSWKSPTHLERAPILRNNHTSLDRVGHMQRLFLALFGDMSKVRSSKLLAQNRCLMGVFFLEGPPLWRLKGHQKDNHHFEGSHKQKKPPSRVTHKHKPSLRGVSEKKEKLPKRMPHLRQREDAKWPGLAIGWFALLMLFGGLRLCSWVRTTCLCFRRW